MTSNHVLMLPIQVKIRERHSMLSKEVLLAIRKLLQPVPQFCQQNKEELQERPKNNLKFAHRYLKKIFGQILDKGKFNQKPKRLLSIRFKKLKTMNLIRLILRKLQIKLNRDFL